MLPASMWALSLRPLKEERRPPGGVGRGREEGRTHARDKAVAAVTAAGNGAPKAENLLSEKQWLGPGPIIMLARLVAWSRSRRRFLISRARGLIRESFSSRFVADRSLSPTK